MYTDGMKRDEVIATLQNHRAELQRRGVVHAALFGSVARDEARADSDIDIMIDIDPQTGDGMSIYDYVNLKRFMERRIWNTVRDALHELEAAVRQELDGLPGSPE